MMVDTAGAIQSQAAAELLRRLREACSRHGADAVGQVLAVQSRGVVDFAVWYRTIESGAEHDTADGGLSRGGAGDGYGVPLSNAQCLTAEIPAMLDRIMQDPRQILDAVDKGLTM